MPGKNIILTEAREIEGVKYPKGAKLAEIDDKGQITVTDKNENIGVGHIQSRLMRGDCVVDDGKKPSTSAPKGDKDPDKNDPPKTANLG
ncbi:hypothetical protein HED60_14970 [Planctomycetales bacterium ZRK34]|nr:hypothetical protein HED60_14970 [Planctomycetales bacterium ZRK34]